MNLDEMKAAVRRLFHQGFSKGNVDIAHEYIAQDYTDHSPIPAPGPGPAGFAQRTARLRAAFVREIEFGVMLAEGDLVAFSWTLRGVHNASFAGVPPTGKEVVLNGLNIERFEKDKIVEHWSQFDLVGLFRQMGKE